jgi:hypothetical protein
MQLDSVPIVIVGQILLADTVGRPQREKNGLPVQLYRVTVHVENVLRGNVQGDVAIYYFSGAKGLSIGSSGLLGMTTNAGSWHLGDRIVFFLRREDGVLRTTCDFRRYCALQVYSGAHPEFRPDASKPLADNLVDLLLTRGERCTDKQMADAILKSRTPEISEAYAYQQLSQLAIKGPLEITRAACEMLSVANRKCPPAVTE